MRLLLDNTATRVAWWLRREFRRSLGEPEIDEALTDAALRAWKSIDSYDASRGTLRAWFYVICRNSALKIIQRERKAAPWVQLPEWDLVADRSAADAAAAVDAAADDDDPEPSSPKAARFVADVRSCVERLPPQQRAVMEADLAASDGVADAATLAESLGTSRNSIYNSRFQARKALRHALVELGHLAPEGSTIGTEERPDDPPISPAAEEETS